MNRYGEERYGLDLQTHTFTKDNCDNYIQLIDKYLEWEKIASESQDIIDKKIGTAKGLPLSNIDFSFYSANQHSHYLVIGDKIYGHYYSKAGAEALKELLIKYKNNELSPLDVNTKYQ
jgi:hypothetical protein